MDTAQTVPAQDLTFQVRAFDSALGAEVVCGDLRTISDEDFERLHSSFYEVPPAASILYAVEIPPVGGTS